MSVDTEAMSDGPLDISAEDRLVTEAIAIARRQTDGRAPMPLDSGWGGLGAFDEAPEGPAIEPSDKTQVQRLGGTVIFIEGIPYGAEADVTTIFRPDPSPSMIAFGDRPA